MVKDLRVAIISDSSLPDARVERTALIYSHVFNLESYLIAPGKPSIIETIVKRLGLNPPLHFVEGFRFHKLARVGIAKYYNRVMDGFKKMLREIDPDLVHAHNIFVAKIVSDLGYDFVLDDHELYSLKIMGRIKKTKLLGYLKSKAKSFIWRRWEKELSERAKYILVVSNWMKNYYEDVYDTEKVSVVPSFPMLIELEVADRMSIDNSLINMINSEDNRLRITYVGSDPIRKKFPYTDLEYMVPIVKKLIDKIDFYIIGIREAKQIDSNIWSLGYVEHLKLLNVLRRMNVGVCAWLPHPLHVYINPNKAYLYAHAGLIQVITSTLKEVIRYIGDFSVIINDPINELEKVLIDLYHRVNELESLRSDIIDFARRKLVLDNYFSIFNKILKEL